MPITRILTAAWLAALALAGGARAQGGGVPDVDGRRLRAGVDSLAVYVIRGGDTTRTGSIRDQLSIIASDEGAALQRVYSTRDAVLGVTVDSIFDRLETLAPLRFRSLGGRESADLRFSPGRAAGRVRRANGDTAAVDVALPPAVYNAASFDLVLRAAELGAGWEADVPAFLASTRTVLRLHAAVTGAETIGGHPCWRVAADFAGAPVTFWIDRRTRQMRQQVMEIGPGVRILIRSASPD
jgi:hypothetical protein